MIANINEFLAHVAAHAGASNEITERATFALIRGIGPYLSPASRELVAGELPPALSATLLSGDDVALPIEERVLAPDISIAHARELIASICHVLDEELSTDAVEALRGAVPPAIARYLGSPAAELAGTAAPYRDNLADGRPGSQHPVSEAHASNVQSESVAAANPHGTRKLSSATPANRR